MLGRRGDKTTIFGGHDGTTGKKRVPCGASESIPLDGNKKCHGIDSKNRKVGTVGLAKYVGTPDGEEHDVCELTGHERADKSLIFEENIEPLGDTSFLDGVEAHSCIDSVSVFAKVHARKNAEGVKENEPGKATTVCEPVLGMETIASLGEIPAADPG